MAISFANRFNADLLDQNYERWRKDPASVDSTWAAFFEGFELGSVQPKNGAAAAQAGAPVAATADAPLQTRVDGLVYAYRTLGHTIANLDPLAHERPQNPLLSLRELGFDEKDLDLTVSSKFLLGGKRMKLREMIGALERIYCGPIGTEFMHIQNPRVRNWLREKIENRPAESSTEQEVQRRILRQLVKVESFEHFLHTKYQGQKRFSLEGGESLITALYGILETCPNRGVEEICLGMAHRGRLSVIAEFLRKPFRTMFAEFSENYLPNTTAGDGDVKYHLGYMTTRKLKSGEEVEVRLSANPSHLEAVNPVVMGMTRARQRIRKDTDDRRKVIAVLIHGDAAFAGQGIVAETLNMSQLQGYRIGGTVHIIVNNQIGFTTLPADARSTTYCTDVAKMIEAPIFHVNGDNPLAVRFVSELALEFRQTFKRDVVIDIYCYRRHGHNEADDPVSTQPTMYADITTHPSVGTQFERQLVSAGVISQEEADALEKEMEERHEKALGIVKAAEKDQTINSFSGSTAAPQPVYTHEPVDTAVRKENLAKVVKALTSVPEGFTIQPKLKSFLLEKRAKVWANNGPFDWAYGEALAMGSLLLEGIPVRLSGQDARRGTFSQRNSYLYDQKTRERYCPLKHISPDQAQVCIYNSLLSESGVLGFDYGYSLNFPNLLCMWEAQFGDFANGAQVIIDQFISSAESKWQRPSSLVLLLPHGYEGQGPEHSSARLERFLQLCAEDNIQVCNLTTPAQYFHVLRRQMKRTFKKPLVIMTPKSMLRLEAAASKLEDFTNDRFHEILADPLHTEPEKVKRVILCTGKVYYDLLKHREEKKITDAAIVRVEQLYPLDEAQLKAAVGHYANATALVWCQEESQNMGAWSYMFWHLNRMFHSIPLWYAGRGASASPAVGSLAGHRAEQKLIIQDAFNLGQ
ncbi:2-oxoglutarate dehydrogenase, E1 subunit [Chthoniobacter flavus Ellin428]|uniref:oxoglutarate dehydrogenase (succinyl-transferring) n=1 Tax=Chthoniobacter flavus Ellin428 TaxID=497964 RepID=B4D136_9BACT|nr:2-oxoglutarate dehydrogenase E1 component [Chthoniobacter flavus]EDY20048.1 2-oxoglutarate dehydrogenase, E1 subunit [Chthoniobacter flavus Ellin428]TCO93946.1 2-oxoglutarate dehydrogenase E1 component [Chthoniobacter flavus]